MKRSAIQRKTSMRRTSKLSVAGSPVPAQRRKPPRGKVTPEVYAEVVERDGSCRAHSMGFGLDSRCGGFRPVVVHHRILKGAGGTSRPEINQPGNLVVLCDLHHDLAHAHPAEASRHGVIIRKGTQ